MAVYVQYSTHSALKTDQTHSNSSASAQAALQAAQALAGVSDDKQTVKWHLRVSPSCTYVYMHMNCQVTDTERLLFLQ